MAFAMKGRGSRVTANFEPIISGLKIDIFDWYKV